MRRADSCIPSADMNGSRLSRYLNEPGCYQSPDFFAEEGASNVGTSVDCVETQPGSTFLSRNKGNNSFVKCTTIKT